MCFGKMFALYLYCYEAPFLNIPYFDHLCLYIRTERYHAGNGSRQTI